MATSPSEPMDTDVPLKEVDDAPDDHAGANEDGESVNASDDESANASDTSESPGPRRARNRASKMVRASGNKRSHSDHAQEGAEEEDDCEDEDEWDEWDECEEGEEEQEEDDFSDGDESYVPDEEEEEEVDEEEERLVQELDEDDDEDDLPEYLSDGDNESLADSDVDDDDEAQQKHEETLEALLNAKIDNVDTLCEMIGIEQSDLSRFVGAAMIMRNIAPLSHMSSLLASANTTAGTDNPYLSELADRTLSALRIMGLPTQDLDAASLSNALRPLNQLHLQTRESFLNEALKYVPDGGVVCKVLLHLDVAMAIVIGAHAASAARTLAQQKREAAGELLEVIFGTRDHADMADADPLAEQYRTTTNDELSTIHDRVGSWVQSANALSDGAFVRRVMLNIAQLSQTPRAFRRAQRNVDRVRVLPIYKGYYDATYQHHVDAKAVKRGALAIRLEVRVPSTNDGGWLDKFKIDTDHFRLRVQGEGFLGIPGNVELQRPRANAGVVAMSYADGENHPSSHDLPEPATIAALASLMDSSHSPPPEDDAVASSRRRGVNKRRKLTDHKPSNPILAANLLQTALTRSNMRRVMEIIKRSDEMVEDEKPTDDDLKQILRLQAHSGLETAAVSTLQTLPALDEDKWIMTARVRQGKYLRPFRGLVCSSVHPQSWARLATAIAKYHGLVTVVLAPRALIHTVRNRNHYDRRSNA